MKRRVFLSGSLSILGLFVFTNQKLFADDPILDTLDVLCGDLLPLSKELDSNSAWYIKNIILKHSKIAKSDKKFIYDGIKWLNEESVKKYRKPYANLATEQREAVLQHISTSNWGDSFIYAVLQYTLESLLGDPIYHINRNQKGWIWLGHQSGYPRPKKAFL